MGSCNADLSTNKILANILFFFAPTSDQWQQLLPVKKTIKKLFFFSLLKFYVFMEPNEGMS